MSYRTILVQVDESRRCPARIDVAIGLARRYDAHLVGLSVFSTFEPRGYVAVEIGASVREIQRRMAAEHAARCEQIFNRATAAAGLTNVEWRCASADPVGATALNARYADLLVLGQADPSDPAALDSDYAQQVVLEAGRPVLMVPYAGSIESVGRRVLVAWNASAEATRALTDAIPLLRDAEEVHLISFNPKAEEHGEIPGSDIGLYLARHRVQVSVKIDRASGIDVGNELLSRAADLGVDLIVMGAYGHTRLREMVLGGATRTLLESMTVPVFLSH
ncbi:MAG: universal stress protein [Rhodocyclaceae bacterium]